MKTQKDIIAVGCDETKHLPLVHPQTHTYSELRSNEGVDRSDKHTNINLCKRTAKCKKRLRSGKFPSSLTQLARCSIWAAVCHQAAQLNAWKRAAQMMKAWLEES